MIRDRIVVGLRDAKLSENLQLDPDLTLEKAVTKARQAEAVKEQEPLVRGSGESERASGSHRQDTRLGAVTHKSRQGKPKIPDKPPDKDQNSKIPDKPPDKDQNSKPSKTCGWCGKSPPHKKAQCPAKDV